MTMNPLIHVANYGTTPVHGVVRVPCNRAGAMYGTESPNAADAKAWLIGDDGSTLTLLVDVPPGFAGTVRTSPFHGTRPTTTTKLTQPLLLNGASLAVVAVREIAPNVLRIEMRGPDARVWLTWSPYNPAVAWGEIVVGYTSPRSTQPTLPVELTLSHPHGVVLYQSYRGSLARGQVVVQPIVVLADDATPADLIFANALYSGTLSVIARDDVWGVDRPMFRGSPLEWSRTHYADAARRIARPDEAAVLGVAKRANDPGAQEDQVFLGECFQGPQSCGAERIRLLTAYTQGFRPCHHTDAQGNPVSPETHPTLVLWDGQPHWHLGVSRDRLGLERIPHDGYETHFWWGPDKQHWIYNSAFVALSLNDSPACEWMWRCAMENFRLTHTVDPRLSTTGFDSARSIGWACLFVWQTYEAAIAGGERLFNHFEQLVERVYLPHLRRVGVTWDARLDDPRLGPGLREIGWQKALGAYGMWKVAHNTGIVREDLAAEMKERAYLAALDIVDRWFFLDGDVWRCHDAMVVGTTEGDAKNEMFDFGTPMAVAVVLMQDPHNQRARSIWRQMVAKGSGKWLPPEALHYEQPEAS